MDIYINEALKQSDVDTMSAMIRQHNGACIKVIYTTKPLDTKTTSLLLTNLGTQIKIIRKPIWAIYYDIMSGKTNETTLVLLENLHQVQDFARSINDSGKYPEHIKDVLLKGPLPVFVYENWR